MRTPLLRGKRLLGSKPLAAIGIVLMITGGIAFFNSLGSGGGYFPAVLVISGAVLIVVAILKVFLKPWLS
jgi:hypothetical protein